MSQTPSSWRTKEQVLIDLANALHFSADALEQNRKGDLAVEQLKRLAVHFLRPVLMAAGLALGPFFIWALIGSFNGANLLDSVSHVFSVAVQPKQLFAEHGLIASLIVLAVTLAGLIMGARKAMHISMALYFDLIERKVIMKEGRIEGREESVFRSDARDPIESYFFDLKTERFTVNSAAVQALDNGAAYYVYILPRSRTLVSLEPKVASGDDVAVAS
jgi:hypothetical protein